MRTAATKAVYYLGWAGVIPFVAGAVLVWFDEPVNPYFVLQAFQVYSLMVLSFLCGTWWGFSFAGLEERLRLVLLLGGITLFVFLWLVMLFVPSTQTLLILGLTYGALLLPELRLRGLPVDRGYRGMRLLLTGIVLLCHLSVYLNVSGIISVDY